MEIVETLKERNLDVRLTCNYRWMVWNSTLALWQVYERKPYDRQTKTIISTQCEQNAVAELIEIFNVNLAQF